MEGLETLGKVAGIGGVALGVLLLVFRETLRKAIVPKLTRHQAHSLFVLALVLVWSVAIAGIGAWAWIEKAPDVTTAPGGPSIETHGDQSPAVSGVNGNVTITNTKDDN
jgi:hypothetical protein